MQRSILKAKQVFTVVFCFVQLEIEPTVYFRILQKFN